MPADPGFRGRGLLLIRRLAQDVHVEEQADRGTTVHFRVSTRAPGHEDAVPRRRTATQPPAEPASLRVVDHVVVMSGELDLASVQELRPTLLAALADRDRATLDLRRVRYLASAGVGLLLEAAARARAAGRELRVLVEPAGPTARILELARLDGLLTTDHRSAVRRALPARRAPGRPSPPPDLGR